MTITFFFFGGGGDGVFWPRPGGRRKNEGSSGPGEVGRERGLLSRDAFVNVGVGGSVYSSCSSADGIFGLGLGDESMRGRNVNDGFGRDGLGLVGGQLGISLGLDGRRWDMCGGIWQGDVGVGVGGGDVGDLGST